MISLAKNNHTARELALHVLLEVQKEGAYSNIALKKALDHSFLSEADKGLATELVYGVVARKLTLEWYLSHFIKDRDQLEDWVYQVLLLALYQYLYLDKIPDHALVYEAVEEAKNRHHQGAAKLINAVLRRVLKEGLPDPQLIKRVNKRYSILYSLPVWLVQKFRQEFGDERAEAIFQSLYQKNKASIRVSKLEDKKMLKELLGAYESQLAPSALLKDSGNLANHSLFREGAYTIQDESSQLVAPTLDIKGDEKILDACAAPGGKTSHIASYLRTGHVVALDLYDHKLRLIEDNAKRLGLSDKVVTQKLDATKVDQAFPADSFDKILVDAPCSGIGLIRRKPDIKYKKESSDFESLKTIQLEILNSVCQTLRKGGIITYSTCTIFKEENFEVLQAFLDSHPEFEQVNLNHPRQEIVVDGCLLITPEQFGSDGFFISQFRKKSS